MKGQTDVAITTTTGKVRCCGCGLGQTLSTPAVSTALGTLLALSIEAVAWEGPEVDIRVRFLGRGFS